MTIDERINEALRRLMLGLAPMRIPADPCDSDLVLASAHRELTILRARVAELEDDFAKRQASHCCPTWNDQMEDCDCDERMGGHIARWQEAEAEVARLRESEAGLRAAVAKVLRRDEHVWAALDELEAALAARPAPLSERERARNAEAQRDEAVSLARESLAETVAARADAARLREALGDFLNCPMVVSEGTNPVICTIHVARERVEKWRAALASAPSAAPTPRDIGASAPRPSRETP